MITRKNYPPAAPNPFAGLSLDRIDPGALADPCRALAILVEWPRLCAIIDDIELFDDMVVIEFLEVIASVNRLRAAGVLFDDGFLGWIDDMQRSIAGTGEDADADLSVDDGQEDDQEREGEEEDHDTTPTNGSTIEDWKEVIRGRRSRGNSHSLQQVGKVWQENLISPWTLQAQLVEDARRRNAELSAALSTADGCLEPDEIDPHACMIEPHEDLEPHDEDQGL